MHEDLVLAVPADPFERRVRLGRLAVTALDALAAEQPAERLRFGLARNRRDANDVFHGRERIRWTYALCGTTSSPASSR